MGIRWGDLGLERFRVRVGRSEALFESGSVVDCADLDTDLEGLPLVVYEWRETSALVPVYEVKAMARVLHPTLSDHKLETVGAVHGVEERSSDRTGYVAAVFTALLSEVERLDREVVALLSQLAAEPLASLFSRALPLPMPQADQVVEKRGPVDEPARRIEERGGLDPLGPDGFVARELPSFERRDGQRAMARSVRRTLRDGGALVVEAGPGTGKTFAYLIPAIERLLADESARVVVSTRTKQLQEQLFGKDLPFLLREMAPELNVALLKGRGNYLCLRRWGIAVRDYSEGLDRDRLHLLAPLGRWLWETETGDIDENTAFLSARGGRDLWRAICDSHHHCIDSFCPHYEDCFSIAARRKARKARLVVVNHSLLLNDLVVDRMILGKYSHAIIDEAHALEEAARSAFTWSLSERHVERAVDELVPSRRRRFGWLRRVDAPADGDLVGRVTDRVATLRTTSSRLFSVLGRQLPSAVKGALPDLSTDAASALERLRLSADGVEESLLDLIDGIDESETRREGEVHLASIRDVGGLAARLVAGPEEDTVRWYDRDAGEVALHITPLEVAPILNRILYPVLDGIVLTSATLSVDGDFGYILRALGVGDAFDVVDTDSVGSPFSYEENMRVCVPRSFPLLTEDREAYVDRLADLLTATAKRLDRKGLVLFTSYEMLEAVRRRLPKSISALAQGVDGPRSKILDRFRRSRRSLVLLGTDSFWEGVDLPGDELEYLVIARLPFAVPTDPIQAALGRLVGAGGGDPFMDLSLPRAVLRLRQGVGRLIRTQQDRGVAIIADRRILTRSYGRTFADSLPNRVEVFDSMEDLVEGLGAWFDDEA